LGPVNVVEVVVRGVGDAEERVAILRVAFEALLCAAAIPSRAAIANERIASDDQSTRMRSELWKLGYMMVDDT
jgi:hypothetical protein